MAHEETTHSAKDELALIARVGAGDRQAFETLFERHHGRVFRFARQMGASSDVAEDITQEVFIALMSCAGRFESRLGSVSTFLYGVTRNLLRRQFRLGASRRETGLSALAECSMLLAPGGAQEDLERREAVTRLREAIAALPDAYREVIVLCHLHELSYEETARVVGCPLGTVRSRLSRARAVLAARLNRGHSCPQPATTTVDHSPTPVPVSRRCLA